MNDSKFQDTVENGYSLITKILKDIPAAHKSWIYTESMSLDEIDKFLYLKGQLNFPAIPSLQPISDDFTLDACLSHIYEGLVQLRAVLELINNKTNTRSARVDDLVHDIRDLLLLIHEMQTQAISESGPRAGPSLRLDSEYMVQVAAHLALVHLRQFGHDISRSLNSLLDA